MPEGLIIKKLDNEINSLKDELSEARRLLEYVLSPAFYAKNRTQRDKPIQTFLSPTDTGAPIEGKPEMVLVRKDALEFVWSGVDDHWIEVFGKDEKVHHILSALKESKPEMVRVWRDDLSGAIRCIEATDSIRNHLQPGGKKIINRLKSAFKEPEPLYPCKDCGTLRTKVEGGTTFTVCDECWDKKYKESKP